MRKFYSSFVLSLVLCVACVNNAKATPYYYMGGGAAVTLLSSWSTSSLTAGVGTPTSFVGSNTWNFLGAGSLTVSTTWTVAQQGTINIGDGTNDFTLVAQAAINTGSNSGTQPQINVKNNAVFSADFSQTFNGNRLNASAGTFVYDANGPTSLFLTLNPYKNVVINNNVTNAVVGVINISGTLTINSGKTVGFSGGYLTANAIDGTGEFIGYNSSLITVTGSGSSTLRFQSGAQFIGGLASTGTGTIVLNNDLSIDGGGPGLTMSSGVLDLNGHNLTFDNGAIADFTGGGAFIGSSSSSILFNNVSGINGSLLMAAGSNTLEALYLNSNGNNQTLTLGNSLNITDSVTAYDGTIDASGNLTIKSTSTLKGRVGMMSATGSISGNVTVENFIRSSGEFTNWTLMGAHGLTNMNVGSWDSQFPVTCTAGCNYTPYDFGSSQGFFSVQGWQEDPPFDLTTCYRYDTSIVAATALTPGKGFWVWLGTNLYTTNAITLSNTGPLVQGDVNLTITLNNCGSSDDGWNLIANPYPCPLSLDAFFNVNSTNVGGTIDLWDSQSGAIVTKGLGDGYILSAGQGFYVVNGFPLFQSSGPVVFSESMKAVNSTAQLMRTSAQTSAPSQFKLKIKGSNDGDETRFRFNNSATSSFDIHYDGRKHFITPGYIGTGATYDHYTSICSRLQNDMYSFNTLPVLTNSMSIPVIARVSATGTYSIFVDEVQNFSSCTLLKDNLTGTYHDLSTGPYVCTISDTTTYSARFEMIICAMNSSTGVKELKESLGDIQVIQDNGDAYVTTHFAQSTKASISVFNVVGQQLIDNLAIEGMDTKTRLNLSSHNEVLFVRVKTDKETVTKKIITH